MKTAEKTKAQQRTGKGTSWGQMLTGEARRRERREKTQTQRSRDAKNREDQCNTQETRASSVRIQNIAIVGVRLNTGGRRSSRPFLALQKHLLMLSIATLLHSLSMRRVDGVEGFVTFLDRALALEPEKRPTAADMLADPFFWTAPVTCHPSQCVEESQPGGKAESH